MDWPIVVDFEAKLAEYLTDALIVNGHPLLHIALDAALRSYEEKIGARDDRRRLAAFVDGALDRTSKELRDISLRREDNAHWYPAGGVSFLQFSQLSGAMVVIDDETQNSDAVKRAVLRYTLTECGRELVREESNV